MVRHYQTKTEGAKWSLEDMEATVKDVASGRLSYKRAYQLATKNNIPHNFDPTKKDKEEDRTRKPVAVRKRKEEKDEEK